MTAGEIQFDRAAAPQLQEGLILLPARLGNRPIQAGITSEALLNLWKDRPAVVDLARVHPLAPILRVARNVIQDKFKRDGVNERGEVVVTLQDI